MTGFGRSQSDIDGMSITVELKSVNHRGFEFSCKSTRSYGFIDDRLKKFFSEEITRGKVDCYVSITALDTDDCLVEINHSLARGYCAALKELADEFSLTDDITVSQLARCSSDIFVIKRAPADEDRVWAAVESVAAEALKAFIGMRQAEGEKLKADVLERAKAIIDDVGFIEKRSPETVAEYNNKLRERIRELIGDATVDEQRLLTEAAIFADKIAVSEETVRLRSHVSQLEALLAGSGSVGRRLDFLSQEMNREANTIGSKCQDVEITSRVLNIKAEVEKIREQIQNIE